MTTTPTEGTPAKCRICGSPPDEHPFRHPFDDGTIDVQLPESDIKKKKDRPPQTPITVALDIITRLTLILVRRGLITEIEAEYVLTGRDYANYADPAGSGEAHVSPESGEAAERGVRDSAGPSTQGPVRGGTSEQGAESP